MYIYILAHDLCHIDNIAWQIFFENQLKMQRVWDTSRKILTK